jgi:hypothetical protein
VLPFQQRRGRLGELLDLGGFTTRVARESIRYLMHVLSDRPLSLGRLQAEIIRRRDHRRRYCPIDLNRGFHSLVFVAGTGRSGTTWFARLINQYAASRLIFEPFHESLGAAAQEGLDLPRYLRPQVDYGQIRRHVERVLRGECSTPWINSRNTRVFSIRRVIKDIHSNLRLAWMREQFPSFPIVLMIRHPCATAVSQERLTSWDPDWADPGLAAYLADEALREDYLAPLGTFPATRSTLEQRIAVWAIETYVPLRQLGNMSDVGIIMYEDLTLNPRRILPPLLSQLGLRPTRRVWRELEVPSDTTFREDGAELTRLRLNEWRRSVTRDEWRRARAILEHFGLDGLYGDASTPLADPRDLAASAGVSASSRL